MYTLSTGVLVQRIAKTLQNQFQISKTYSYFVYLVERLKFAPICRLRQHCSFQLFLTKKIITSDQRAETLHVVTGATTIARLCASPSCLVGPYFSKESQQT